MQGFFKFGFYEVFKKSYAELVGGGQTAEKYRIPIWLAASASAEVIGTTIDRLSLGLSIVLLEIILLYLFFIFLRYLIQYISV